MASDSQGPWATFQTLCLALRAQTVTLEGPSSLLSHMGKLRLRGHHFLSPKKVVTEPRVSAAIRLLVLSFIRSFVHSVPSDAKPWAKPGAGIQWELVTWVGRWTLAPV